MYYYADGWSCVLYSDIEGRGHVPRNCQVRPLKIVAIVCSPTWSMCRRIQSFASITIISLIFLWSWRGMHGGCEDAYSDGKSNKTTLWQDNTHLGGQEVMHNRSILRFSQDRSNVCSIMTYGAEGWQLNVEVSQGELTAAYAYRNHGQVTASLDTRTFDLLRWIRVRSLQRLGHILHIGSERKSKQEVFEILRRRDQAICW